MKKLKKEISVLLCKIEKKFPSRIFNSMQHLLIYPRPRGKTELAEKKRTGCLTLKMRPLLPGSWKQGHRKSERTTAARAPPQRLLGHTPPSSVAAWPSPPTMGMDRNREKSPLLFLFQKKFSVLRMQTRCLQPVLILSSLSNHSFLKSIYIIIRKWIQF
jgi:hypothetical protein